MSNTDPLVQLLLHSISKPTVNPDGSVGLTYDVEQLKYRLLDIKSDNFVAFLTSYKDMLATCQRLETTQLPAVGVALAEYFRSRVESMMIGVTGQASENAELIRLLLQDRTEQFVTLQSTPENRGLMDRLGAGSRPQQQQQAPQQPPR